MDAFTSVDAKLDLDKAVVVTLAKPLSAVVLPRLSAVITQA